MRVDISGEEKIAGFISAIRYATSEKAYAYINVPGYYKPGGQGHTAIANLAAEVNLHDRFMKKIGGLGPSSGFGVMPVLYKGIVLVGNSSTKAKGIYFPDTQTGKVSKRPMLTTADDSTLYHYFDR